MPNCKNCGNHFPNKMLINGKHRILNKRKYCLECSPFGTHNTRPIGEKKEGRELICSICKKRYVYKRGFNHGKDMCNSCKSNCRRFELKKKCVEYMGGKCKGCGYNRCTDSLCFHHIDPSLKEFAISGNHCYRWDKIKLELDKCVLLCNNCHGEVHAGVRQNNGTWCNGSTQDL